MKRMLQVFLACLFLLLFCLSLQASALEFDGDVNLFEWYDYPPVELFQTYSQCGITNASVRFALQPAQNRVLFGFTASAPGVEEGSPVGAAFWLGGQELGRWQLGIGGAFDAVNYDLLGLACIPADTFSSSYTFEIALGYKTEAALAALRDLAVQLFDPQGNPSRVVPCPVVTAEPVTTTKATTTERTTTTKAPSTEKPTTTKATTTAKPTTTKATTTLPVYTTAPPAYIPPTQAPANGAPAAPRATTPPPASTTRTAQPTSRTEVFYYTVLYTEDSGMDATEPQTLWTYPPQFTTEPSQAQTLPTLALPASQQTKPVSRGGPLLYAAVGVLTLLGAALFILWLRAQKKPPAGPPAT